MFGLKPMGTWIAAQGRAIQLALLLAIVPRVWLALGDHSVFWPDEIYQSIEPAHRLAFGYGLLPWEFRDGARSWSFPALLAVPMKLLGLLGVKSALGLVVAARLVMVALAVWGIALGIEYARRLAGKSAAVLAAFGLALCPPLLAYSHRTMQEAASVPFVLVVPLLLMGRTTAHARWAGYAIAVATLLRFQCGLIAAVFLVGLVVERRTAELTAYIKAGATVALAGGVLDWFTWGRPFHSFITYVQFNVIRGGASTFGISPPDYFVKTLWTSAGPMVFLLAIGLVASGLLKARAAALAVILFVGLHSGIPHKEFRFVLTVLPLMLSLGAAGLVLLLERFKAPKWAPAFLTAALSLGFIRAVRGADYGDYGQYEGTARATNSIFNSEEEPNLLLSDAGGEADTCGVLMLGIRAAFTGGYSYLHRRVPLMYRFQACDEIKSANYVIAAQGDKNVPPQYGLVRARGGYGLFKRAGTCAPPPEDFDDMLDGANDMGLGRGAITQPDPRELRINAGSSAAAFVHGFGNGEHLDCRHVRWAIGTSARMAFPLEPVNTPYMLSFTAQPYGRALPQTVAITVNETLLARIPVEEGWRGYQFVLPPQSLRQGRNLIDFKFAQARRALGDDERVLATLFDQISLAPFESTMEILFGTSEGRRYLEDGFSGDEHAGEARFVWNDGPRSRLVATMAAAPTEYILQVTGHAYEPIAPIAINVTVNDEYCGALNIGASSTRASVVIPARTIRDGRNVIDFAYSKTAQPKDHEVNATDSRQLAIRFERLKLSTLSPRASIDIGTADAGEFLAGGFSRDEASAGRTFAWSIGPRSQIRFRPPGPPNAAYRVELTTQAFAPTMPQEVSVSLNGAAVGAFKPGLTWSEAHVGLPAGGLRPGINVLELSYLRTARPAPSAGGDNRDLAVGFDKVEIVKVDPSDTP